MEKNKETSSNAGTGTPSLGIFCTKQQAADLLGVSCPTLDRYRNLPGFPKARVLSGGHAIRFKTAELIQWLDSRTNNKE